MRLSMTAQRERSNVLRELVGADCEAGIVPQNAVGAPWEGGNTDQVIILMFCGQTQKFRVVREDGETCEGRDCRSRGKSNGREEVHGVGAGRKQ